MAPKPNIAMLDNVKVNLDEALAWLAHEANRSQAKLDHASEKGRGPQHAARRDACMNVAKALSAAKVIPDPLPDLKQMTGDEFDRLYVPGAESTWDAAEEIAKLVAASAAEGA